MLSVKIIIFLEMALVCLTTNQQLAKRRKRVVVDRKGNYFGASEAKLQNLQDQIDELCQCILNITKSIEINNQMIQNHFNKNGEVISKINQKITDIKIDLDSVKNQIDREDVAEIVNEIVTPQFESINSKVQNNAIKLGNMITKSQVTRMISIHTSHLEQSLNTLNKNGKHLSEKVNSLEAQIESVDLSRFVKKRMFDSITQIQKTRMNQFWDYLLEVEQKQKKQAVNQNLTTEVINAMTVCLVDKCDIEEKKRYFENSANNGEVSYE